MHSASHGRSAPSGRQVSLIFGLKIESWMSFSSHLCPTALNPGKVVVRGENRGLSPCTFSLTLFCPSPTSLCGLLFLGAS